MNLMTRLFAVPATSPGANGAVMSTFVQRLRRCWPAALAAVVATAAVLGCGGGVGTGGTGTFASGPITGLGSIFVGGIRFDDSTASVADEDGGVRSRADLRLGMTVQVDAGDVSTSSGEPRATARSVRLGSELLGPVEAVDLPAGRLTVLGQRVDVGPDTVIDPRLPRGLSGLAPGRVVEVYAQHDAASGRYRATRIEPVDVAVGYALRGVTDAVDPGNAVLRVGGVRFSFAGINAVPTGLAPGSLVRLKLAQVPDSQGRWVVTAFGAAANALPADREIVRMEGPVTRFDSLSQFQVNGVVVDATTASFPDGTAGLGLGARVEVEGAAAAGILRASRVSIKSDAVLRERGFDLIGAIDSVDRVGGTFVLRGITISSSRPDLRLDDGTLADLLAGRQVEVRALAAGDRTLLEATRIKFVR
ncbi:MAG: DUF5666 domain-containing protein [Aquabacterium sp.]